MKKLLFAMIALAALALTPQARAQQTFSVIKASVSLPGTYAIAIGGGTLTKNFTLNTKSVINLALGQDLSTPVPKDVVLGFAGIFSAFAKQGPDNNTAMQLVVFKLPPKDSMTEVGTKLVKVADGGNRFSAEDVDPVSHKYKRVATGFLSFVQNPANNPNVTGGFLPNISYPSDLNSILQLTATTTRTPNEMPATPATLKVKTSATAAGCALFIVKVPGGIQARQLIVSKGKFSAAGKILGTFDE
jgi:hypothetical protein